MRHHKKRASSHDGARVNVPNTFSLFIQFDRLFSYNSSIYLLILIFFPTSFNGAPIWSHISFQPSPIKAQPSREEGKRKERIK
jgi:hypothetical protein